MRPIVLTVAPTTYTPLVPAGRESWPKLRRRTSKEGKQPTEPKAVQHEEVPLTPPTVSVVLYADHLLSAPRASRSSSDSAMVASVERMASSTPPAPVATKPPTLHQTPTRTPESPSSVLAAHDEFERLAAPVRLAKRIRADSAPALPLGEAAVAKALAAREKWALTRRSTAKLVASKVNLRHEHWGHTQSVSMPSLPLLPPVPVSARASQLAWLRASEKQEQDVDEYWMAV